MHCGVIYPGLKISAPSPNRMEVNRILCVALGLLQFICTEQKTKLKKC